MASSAAQVGSILQPLASHENPPTYFRTNKFTSSFQVRRRRRAQVYVRGSRGMFVEGVGGSS